MFVGSERAGRAAAIYYSLVESCKANKVNPLTYLTHAVNAQTRIIGRLPMKVLSFQPGVSGNYPSIGGIYR
jgi:hypothetical protein